MGDFNYILNNFEDIIGKPLLIYDECKELIENYLSYKLNNYEIKELKKIIKKVQEELYRIRQEMIEMDNNMYEEWYNWRMEYNYDLYDSYLIKKQIDIWENFKQYYDTIELCENEWNIYDDYNQNYEHIYDEYYDY